MKLFTAIVLAVLAGAQTKPAGSTKVPAALNFTMNTIDGKPVDLSKYQGRVVLMVNVASQCGYTPQYEGLEDLHKKYAAKGLSILGFPANDFGAQEPGTNGEIAQFCKQNYGVEFDMFSKIVVKGSGQAPLYIGDIATVAKTDDPTASLSRVDGKPSLTIAVTKLPSANTVEVSHAVSALIPNLETKLVHWMFLFWVGNLGTLIALLKL